MASLLPAAIPLEFAWMATDVAGMLLKTPADQIHIAGTSDMINLKMLWSLHRAGMVSHFRQFNLRG
jgi:hypothetical protein